MSRNLQECEFHYVSGGSAFENALNACTDEITRLSNSPCPNGICDIYPVEDLSGDHLLACPTPAPSAPSTGSSSSSWWGGWKPSFPWSGWFGWFGWFGW